MSHRSFEVLISITQGNFEVLISITQGKFEILISITQGNFKTQRSTFLNFVSVQDIPQLCNSCYLTVEKHKTTGLIWS